MPGSALNPVYDDHHYDPDKHIPDLFSKVIIVTGGNNGIGKAAVIELAKHNPKRLYLAARSKAKYDTAMQDVRAAAPTGAANVDFLELDLASFASVKRAADHILASNDRLDILINNAGVMGLPPHPTTQEGYEIHFGTNHMGHALLTKLLLPLLLKTAAHKSESGSESSERPGGGDAGTGTSTGTGSDVRIVNLSSGAHRMPPTGIFLPDQVVTPMEGTWSYTRYAQSKMANVLHTRELARRYSAAGIVCVAADPGRVQTPLLDEMFKTRSLTTYFQKTFDYFAKPLSAREGAFTTLWCATFPNDNDKDETAVKSGELYVPFGHRSPGHKKSRDEGIAKTLWDWQEAEFAKHGY
ncbi:hypothetical protein LTR96_000876 [Exophiala xenobiotica]|nr:hypothetical protein H2202_004821 [Exophiala xenobiotica]KAK5213548.1 hypothetical protein LTR41_001127 [Exophiala xenobiotica]KAK5237838.1 hypothetical protein LTR47_000931 [Exophiala xenobiotica]KAK5250949.1 hypothetical protein LTS06_004279 [Exophiala xenobiotica]KAK5260576.1 hypothetical protein LTR40_003913 [Exophiala xenobiotica]